MSRLWLCIAVAASSLPVAFLVNHIVPQPYMDEIFHVPQMKQYCKGDFQTWDPMITTPPGLYVVTYIYTSLLHIGAAALKGAYYLSDWCSTPVLRHVNILLSIICTVLFREITLHVEPGQSPAAASLKALALTCYPLHWFFNFLFYTDVGSTMAVMAMYLACLKQAYWTSGLMGLVAISFRQTNVVWACFVACVGILNLLYDQRPVLSHQSSHKGQLHSASNHKSPQQTHKCAKYKIPNEAHDNILTAKEDLVEEIIFISQEAWQKRWSLIRRFFPLMLPILSFLIFVFYNGGIVLGAKEAHKASPHFAQILYFGAAAMLAVPPVHLDPSLIRQNFRRLFAVGLRGYLMAGLIGVLSCIHFFSLAHPYLVSDNRHYTFYIWRRIINAHWSAKYLLSVVYIYSWCSILTLLGQRKKKIWLVIYLVAVVAVLVPAPLIEFRYYTLPFFFIALHVPFKGQKDFFKWGAILLQFFVTNFITMYTFLYKPFYWAGEKEPQRFLW